MMLHPERSPYARVGPARAPCGNDLKFLTDPRLRIGAPREPGHFHREWGIGPVECQALARLVAYFGYDVSVGAREEVSR